MPMLWAMFAPLLATAAMRMWGPAAVQIAYHLLCLGVTITEWKRIRPLLAWTPECFKLSWQLSLVIPVGIIVPGLIWDARALRPGLTPMLFPHGYSHIQFLAAILFTAIVHVPLEEFYWRGAALDEAQPVKTTLWGSVFWFYWLHAAPLSLVLGTTGLLIAIPTAVGGALWAHATFKSKSLWPAIISHWSAEVAILWGVWRCLRP